MHICPRDQVTSFDHSALPVVVVREAVALVAKSRGDASCLEAGRKVVDDAVKALLNTYPNHQAYTRSQGEGGRRVPCPDKRMETTAYPPACHWSDGKRLLSSGSTARPYLAEFDGALEALYQARRGPLLGKLMLVSKAKAYGRPQNHI